ncbi:hypothetical protein Pcinc_007376 [Petrolisthes cinctipes]|uniref:Uncharacterized protein n=1 Tax=Petrolisthes cinctipes TaxID=88211 RepID=A0AAE1KX18_PETCI|nr:hypothetical protein Pcinc_007376 [Petrolisthes cinctipes]
MSLTSSTIYPPSPTSTHITILHTNDATPQSRLKMLPPLPPRLCLKRLPPSPSCPCLKRLPPSRQRRCHHCLATPYSRQQRSHASCAFASPRPLHPPAWLLPVTPLDLGNRY